MSPQSCVFRLFARSCHLPHTARTLYGEINARVSRGATVTSHVKDLPPSNVISMRPSGLLPSWRTKPTGSLAMGPQQLRKLEQRDRSAYDVWTIYLGPVCRQGCANRERRPAIHIGKGAGHIIIMDARSAMRPCYILPVFFYLLYIFYGRLSWPNG